MGKVLLSFSIYFFNLGFVDFSRGNTKLRTKVREKEQNVMKERQYVKENVSSLRLSKHE